MRVIDNLVKVKITPKSEDRVVDGVIIPALESPLYFYINNELKHTYSPQTPLVLHKKNDATDSFKNWNGEKTNNNSTINLSNITDWQKNTYLGVSYFYSYAITNLVKKGFTSQANAKCENYLITDNVTGDVARLINDKMFFINTDGRIYVRDDEQFNLSSGKPQGIMIYELANATTEIAQSILLNKRITKCVDKNGNEADLEKEIEPFTNKIADSVVINNTRIPVYNKIK